MHPFLSIHKYLKVSFFQVATECGVVVRVSISNLYKQFKATATWLQFPFTISDGSAAPISKWTVLLLNFPAVLAKYVNRNFTHIKTIKICANVLVKNIFTSNNTYNPLVIDKKVKKVDDITGSPDEPLPREMRYPVPSGHVWEEFYNFIRFPPIKETLTVPIRPSKQGSLVYAIQKPKDKIFKDLPMVKDPNSPVIPLTNENEYQSSLKDHNITEFKTLIQESKAPSKCIEEDFQNLSLLENVSITSKRSRKTNSNSKANKVQPDPIAKLDRVLGLGPYHNAFFTQDSRNIIYSTGSLVIKQDIADNDQKIFHGHTNTVLSIASDTQTQIMATSQKDCPLVRIWNVNNQECISVIKSSDSPCNNLVFTNSGSLLYGTVSVKCRSVLIVWETALVKRGGDVTVMNQTKSDETILHIVASPASDQKFATSSVKGVKLWRIRNKSLKFCSITSFAGKEYVIENIAYGPALGDDASLFIATASGSVLEVDCIKAVWKRSLNINGLEKNPVNSLAFHEAFSVSGGADGMLKVWSPEFSEVLVSAEHESGIDCVAISSDGLKILAVTDVGTLGVLDATTKAYKTIVRGHSKR